MREANRQRRHEQTAAYRWHRALVEACRPYRATHGPVLRAVGTFLRNRHGTRWYVKPANRALALSTLHRFGVALNLESCHA